MLISRLKPSRLNAPIIIPNQIIYHSAGDNYGVDGHINWQWNGDLESHAYTSRPGDIYQIVAYNRRAQANFTANGPRADGTGALSMETGSSIDANEPWYDDQIDAMVDWSRDRISQFPTILPRRCPSANASGLGYHIMFGTPGAWTPVAKACPGPERIKQFNQVLLPRITRAAGTVIDLGGNRGGAVSQQQSDEAPTQDPPSTEEDEDMALQLIQVKGEAGVYAYGPGKFYGLEDQEVINVGAAAGMFKLPVREVNARERDVTRAIALKLVEGEGGINVAK